MYTIKEFADKVGRTDQTIRLWLQKGLLKRKMFSGSLFFTDADLIVAQEIKTKMITQKENGMKWNATKN